MLLSFSISSPASYSEHVSVFRASDSASPSRFPGLIVLQLITISLQLSGGPVSSRLSCPASCNTPPLQCGQCYTGSVVVSGFFRGSAPSGSCTLIKARFSLRLLLLSQPSAIFVLNLYRYNSSDRSARFLISLKPRVIFTRDTIEIPVHFSVGAVFQKILCFRS